MVDTGLMRKDEFKQTYKIFKNKYKQRKANKCLEIILKNLKNISDPEKRKDY